MLYRATHCTGYILANTRPHQLHQADHVMGTALSCKKDSQVTGHIHRIKQCLISALQQLSLNIFYKFYQPIHFAQYLLCPLTNFNDDNIMRIIIECSFLWFRFRSCYCNLVDINTVTVHFQAASNTPEYFSEVCELLWGIVNFVLPLYYLHFCPIQVSSDDIPQTPTVHNEVQ